MSAQYIPLFQKIREWFHPAEATLRTVGNLYEEIGFKKGYEQAKQELFKRLPAQWQPPGAPPLPAPTNPVIDDAQAELDEELSEEELREWETWLDQPAESYIQRCTRKAWEECETGAKPGEYVRLTNKFLHEHDAPRTLRPNPLARPAWLDEPLPESDAWLVQSVPSRALDELAELAVKRHNSDTLEVPAYMQIKHGIIENEE